MRETALVLQRQGKLCNFIEWKDLKIVYKRYASLYFCCLTDAADNELMTVESIHLFVECLDRYFGNVCELDLVFNFHKAYFILDEVFLGGQVQETSKKAVEHFIIAQDTIVEQEKMGEHPHRGLTRRPADARGGGEMGPDPRRRRAPAGGALFPARRNFVIGITEHPPPPTAPGPRPHRAPTPTPPPHSVRMSRQLRLTPRSYGFTNAPVEVLR